MPRMVAEGPAPPGTPRAAWTALGIVTVAHAAGSFAMLGVAPLAPFLVDALGLTRAHVVARGHPRLPRDRRLRLQRVEPGDRQSHRRLVPAAPPRRGDGHQAD